MRPPSRHRARPMRPHPGPTPAGDETSGIGSTSGAFRAAVFGVNDGLVSNLSLIMGVAGAGVDRKVILLAGLAGLLAGAFSMAAGEYISMRTQREMFERLIHVEAHELGTDPSGETYELTKIFERKGLSPELAEEVARQLMRDPVVALETHAREELGLDPRTLGSPQAAAASSFATFSAGAAVPLLPFAVAAGEAATFAAIAGSLAALLAVGGAMAGITKRPVLWSAIRMALLGGFAALVTYGVGRLLGVAGLS